MKQDMLREESRHNDINVRNDGDVEEDVCKDLAEPLDDFGQKLVTIRQVVLRVCDVFVELS